MMSSGSTGQQTITYIDRQISAEIFATQLLFWSWNNFYMGSSHLQTGMSLDRPFLKKAKDVLFNCRYKSAFNLTNNDLRSIQKEIIKNNVPYIFGYASSIFSIAQFFRECKVKHQLKGIFTWGDCLFPQYRKTIESVFMCKVTDYYGMGEGLQIAAQCQFHNHLHLAEHHVLVEINGRYEYDENNDYMLGKVIATRLTPGPMPLVRYDTGDLASFTPNNCICSRKLKTISRVHGRDTDIIQTPLGDRLIVHYFTQIFEMYTEITQFQVKQKELECIEIFYIPGEGFKSKILMKIRDEIHEKCQYKLKIYFKEVNTIPLEKSNKRRFVISSIPYR
jgi:phenylacetate-CoA ligase